MPHFMRRPLRGLRLLIATALFSSLLVATPVTATAVEPDDSPATAVTPSASSFQGSVETTGDVVDVYRFDLTEGQFISLDVTQRTEATASAGFFGPGTTDVSDLSSAISSATIDATSSVFAADFTAQAGDGGDYYLSVAAVSGATTYTVDWSVSDPTFSLDLTSTVVTVTEGQSAADSSFDAEWGELGSVPVTFTAESDQPWLVVTPGTGAANSNTSQTLTLAAYTSSLSIGSYEATVTVRILGAAPQKHRMTVNVLDPDTSEPDDTLPGIAAPASPFQGAVDPITDKRDVYSFELTEGQFLHVEVAQSAETTAVATLFGPGASEPIDPASAIGSGTVTSGTDYVVDVTAKGGEAGTYYLNVAAVSGATTYTVDWSVSDPAFSLDLTSTVVTVTEGQSAADSSFDAEWGELGSVPVTFTAESDQPWLVVTPGTGAANSNTTQQLTLETDTSTLAVGSHEAMVTVRILGADAQTHRVTVDVNALEQTVARIARSAPRARTTTSGSLIVKYGTQVTLYASLRNRAGVLMPSKQMTLQRSYDNKTWRGVTSPVSANGFFAASTKVYRKTYFRWVFSGDDTAAASVTPSALVYSYAYVSPPRNIPSRVRPNRTYHFYGYLRPKHAQGASAIRVQFQYYYRGRWRSDTSLKVESPGTSVRFALPLRRSLRQGRPPQWRVESRARRYQSLDDLSSWKFYKVY